MTKETLNLLYNLVNEQLSKPLGLDDEEDKKYREARKELLVALAKADMKENYSNKHSVNLMG